MQATEILSNEHRVIEQVLDCLEALVEQSLAQGRAPLPPAEEILDFLRSFADGCHHAKEENHLFPWLERHGFSRQFGPTGVMLREHSLGRHHMRQMALALPGAVRGDARDLEAFAQAARSYIRLLKEHIQKEDNCLFAMAVQVATPQDDHDLVEAYGRTEAKDIGAGVHEKYLALADKLADQLGVIPRAVSRETAGCGHCGHSA